MSSNPQMTRRVFGIENPDPSKAASESSARFVRDQDHVAFFTDGATGRVFTAPEALRSFGLEKLYEI